MSKCIGCGILLQDKDIHAVGYTSNLENKICERCFKLKYYGQYQSVSFTNKEYQQIIDRIPKNAFILYTADILSLNIHKIEKWKNVILVITKRDILPKSIKDEKIIEYMKRKFQSVLDVVVVSSEKNYNMDRLYQLMRKYSNCGEFYLVGNTNSGKSTLLNKLVADYGTQDQSSNVTVSMYPSTTLDQVVLEFDDFKIIDTPGLIDSTNIVNVVDGASLKNITPRKEIKPKSCQIKGRGSILIGAFARIDYETEGANSMVIYTSNRVDIRFASIKSEVLKDLPSYFFDLSSKKDIVIPGLGFIKFVSPIKVWIYTLDKVVPFERDNLI